MYNLLAICLILQPRRIDESIQSQLTEKMSEKMNRMARGFHTLLFCCFCIFSDAVYFFSETADFENAFQVGCPKFLSPTSNNFESTANFSKVFDIFRFAFYMNFFYLNLI